MVELPTREDIGLGRTRLKLIRFIVDTPQLDDGTFMGQVVFNIHNIHQNATGQVIPAARKLHLGEESTDGIFV